MLILTITSFSGKTIFVRLNMCVLEPPKMVILPPDKSIAVKACDEFSFWYSDMKISYTDTINENIKMGHKQVEANLCIYEILVLPTPCSVLVLSKHYFICNTRRDGHGLRMKEYRNRGGSVYLALVFISCYHKTFYYPEISIAPVYTLFWEKIKVHFPSFIVDRKMNPYSEIIEKS